MHNVPMDSESHFKVIIVSDKFEGMSLIEVVYRYIHVLQRKLINNNYVIIETPFSK